MNQLWKNITHSKIAEVLAILVVLTWITISILGYFGFAPDTETSRSHYNQVCNITLLVLGAYFTRSSSVPSIGQGPSTTTIEQKNIT
jgi:hypothetical protein